MKNHMDDLRRIAGWVRDRVRRGEPADQEAGEEMPNPAMLRERLWRVREDALYEMARYGIEPTRLALAADANAAPEALGEAPSWREPGSRSWRLLLDNTKVDVAPACRAVVSDDGTEIRLTLYSDAGAVASVVLDTARAVALAGRLIEAALSRLSS